MIIAPPPPGASPTDLSMQERPKPITDEGETDAAFTGMYSALITADNPPEQKIASVADVALSANLANSPDQAADLVQTPDEIPDLAGLVDTKNAQTPDKTLVAPAAAPVAVAEGLPRDPKAAAPMGDDGKPVTQMIEPITDSTGSHEHDSADRNPTGPQTPAPPPQISTDRAAVVPTGFASDVAEQGAEPAAQLSSLAEAEQTTSRAEPGRMTPVAPQPKLVAAQIAQASIGSEGSVEIRLDPAELGKIRLTLHTTDGGMNVQITAERPETIDLLRRNSALLEAEFERIGLSDIGFDFTQSQDDFASDAPPDAETWYADGEDTAEVATSEPGRPYQRIPSETGLDLRL